MLMHRAALNRHVGPERGERLLEAGRAVDDDEFRRLQASLTRSSRSARQASSLSPPMFLTASSTFWPSCRTPTPRDAKSTSPSCRAERARPCRRGWPDDRLVLQGARVPGVPVTFHLAPGPANHIFAHSAFENRRKRTAHTAHVGPGQIGARDQSFGSFRAPLIGALAICSSAPTVIARSHR